MELIILVFVGIALLAASFTDIKTREVPDWISYGTIVLGVGVRLILAATGMSWQPLLDGLIGGIVFSAIAFALFYAGQWGGGDSKLFMGIGVLLGIPFRTDAFALSFLINLVIVGGVYGLFWCVIIGLAKMRKVRPAFAHELRGSLLSISRIVSVPIGLLFIVMTFFQETKIPGFVLAAVVLVFPYLFALVKAVEKTALTRVIRPRQLVEGDWVLEKVIVGGKTVYSPSKTGIERDDIRRLVLLGQQGKVDAIKVKDGIPFVPSFLLAFIATALIGNAIVVIVGLM